jgi:hypothetical protein
MKAALWLSTMGTHVMTTSTALVCLGLAAKRRIRSSPSAPAKTGR